MKKSKFTALVLCVAGALITGLGMCMCMLPEWGLYREGIIVGCAGLLVLLAAAVIYRRMEHKAPVRITLKAMLRILAAASGALCLGTGMCLTLVYGRFVPGIAVGAIGIAVLLALLPLCMGIKD